MNEPLLLPIVNISFRFHEYQHPPSSSKLTRSSIWLGFVTGFFIQLSTIGAYTLTLFLLGRASTEAHSDLLTLLWSLLLCTLGISIVWTTTSMVVSHYSLPSHNQSTYMTSEQIYCDDTSSSGCGSIHHCKQIRSTIESRFLVGAVASLSSSCVFLEYILQDRFRWEIVVFGVVMALFYWLVPKLFLEVDDDEIDDCNSQKNQNEGYDIEEA